MYILNCLIFLEFLHNLLLVRNNIHVKIMTLPKKQKR